MGVELRSSRARDESCGGNGSAAVVMGSTVAATGAAAAFSVRLTPGPRFTRVCLSVARSAAGEFAFGAPTFSTFFGATSVADFAAAFVATRLVVGLAEGLAEGLSEGLSITFVTAFLATFFAIGFSPTAFPAFGTEVVATFVEAFVEAFGASFVTEVLATVFVAFAVAFAVTLAATFVATFVVTFLATFVTTFFPLLLFAGVAARRSVKACSDPSRGAANFSAVRGCNSDGVDCSDVDF